MKTNTKRKISIFLRRVSTEQQSLEMQIAADKKYRDVLDEDEYIEVNELGVSANKIKLKQREKMKNVINLINNGEVSSLYVYDRSRLTRNFYEYLELVELFIENDIQVIFTTSALSYAPFSFNYLIEGISGILIEEEGQSIARRVSEAHRKLPAKKFGFQIEKENGLKSYVALPEQREKIIVLFEAVKEVSSVKDFIGIVLNHAKTFQKRTEDIIRILGDAFYAGCEQNGGKLYPLSYVEPIITQTLFEEVQSVIKPYVQVLQQDLNGRACENIFQPKCGICKNEMRYKKNNVGKSGSYTCSKKHKKNTIDVDVYNDMLLECISTSLSNLNEEMLEKVAVKLIKSVLLEQENELHTIDNKIEKLEFSIATLDTTQFQSLLGKQADFKELTEMKKQRKYKKELILYCENHQNNIKHLIDKVRINTMLKEEEVFSIASLILKDCFVWDGSLEFHLYFNEFLNSNNLERMN